MRKRMCGVRFEDVVVRVRWECDKELLGSCGGRIMF